MVPWHKNIHSDRRKPGNGKKACHTLQIKPEKAEKQQKGIDQYPNNLTADEEPQNLLALVFHTLGTKSTSNSFVTEWKCQRTEDSCQ